MKLERTSLARGAALVAVFTTLAACSGSSGSSDTPEEPAYSISGSLSGAVVAGVTVKLTGARTGTTTTSAAGAYSFGQLPNGTYAVAPSLAGYTFDPVSKVTTIAGTSVAGQNFAASASGATYTISGTISGAAGAIVTLSGAAAGQTTADAAGHYAFAGLANGNYTVTPALAGYAFAPGSRQVTVADFDVADLDFGAASTPAAANPYEDFSSGALAQTRWDDGQMFAGIFNQAASLTQASAALTPTSSNSTSLVVIPPGGGEVTTIQADVTVMDASATNDAEARAGVDLFFQPAASRLSGPYGFEGGLFARIALVRTATGVIAKRYLFACYNDLPDCMHSIGVGAATGDWSLYSPPSATVGTKYTVSISVNTATKVVTYSISGNDLTASGTIDASSVAVPFAVDFSAPNFCRARLFSNAKSTNGGANGSIAASFDNVAIGVDGSAASSFDDFDTGTDFDPTRWKILPGGANGRASALVGSGALQIELDQADVPGSFGANLTDTSASALQATVTVSQWVTNNGEGHVGAQIRQALYNDGSNGSGVAPDTNGVSSQVGDLHAILSATDVGVLWAVVRCESALCDEKTFVQPFTLLSVATAGPHTLYLNWDAANHRVAFLLDGQGVAFDPVASGYAVSASPSRPLKRLAVEAGDASVANVFGSGSSASISAAFDDVKTN